MAINRATDRFLPTLNGNVLLSGGSLNLAKGQLGIFETKNNTKNGLKAVSNFAGVPKNREFELKVGVAPVSVTRTQDNYPKSSLAFRLDEIEKLTVNAPSLKKSVDELIIGYDGIDVNTALTFEKGDAEVLDIELSGDAIGMLGYPKSKVNIKIYFDNDEDLTDQEIVENAIKRLKETRLVDDIPVTDYIDVLPVNSENTDPFADGDGFVFFHLTLQDDGSSNALAEVQAQFNADRVVRSSYENMHSTYTILRESGDTPADFQRITHKTKQTCEDCPEGYDTYLSGFLYSVTLEDDGVDLSTTVDNLPGFITDSVTKTGQNNGVGTYLVVVSAKLTDGQIGTFVTANPTATVDLVADIAELCIEEVVSNLAWDEGKTCTAQTEKYTITLKDDDCGGNLLAELQASYPELTITVEQAEGFGTSTDVTLTGASGTATITIGGEDFLATFDDDLTVTAAAFVSTHEEDLAAMGITVTSEAAVLTFVDVEGRPIEIDGATGNLDGTVGESEPAEGNLVGGCQTVFATEVTTNVVCEECDPILTDMFLSEAPEPFNMTEWRKAPKVYSENALMGILLRAKETLSIPGEDLRDAVPFIHSSVRIQAAGGYNTGVFQNFKKSQGRFAVKLRSKQEDLENLGGNLWVWEDRDFTYFNGYPRTRKENGFENEYRKQILGEESVLKASAQYVIYTLTVRPRTSQNPFIADRVESMNYMIAVEVGKHLPVENLLNSLAGAAGVPGVQAYGVED